jgi:hypothetical protein
VGEHRVIDGNGPGVHARDMPMRYTDYGEGDRDADKEWRVETGETSDGKAFKIGRSVKGFQNHEAADDEEQLDTETTLGEIEEETGASPAKPKVIAGCVMEENDGHGREAAQ